MHHTDNVETLNSLLIALRDNNLPEIAVWASRLRCICGDWIDEHTPASDGVPATCTATYPAADPTLPDHPCACDGFILSEH